MKMMARGRSNFAHGESVKRRNLGVNHPTAMISKINAAAAMRVPDKIDDTRSA
jgi:hypothetical protein